jgi:hypothetical protein
MHRVTTAIRLVYMRLFIAPNSYLLNINVARVIIRVAFEMAMEFFIDLIFSFVVVEFSSMALH